MIIEKKVSKTVPAVPERTVTETMYTCLVCHMDLGKSEAEAKRHYGLAHSVKKTAKLHTTRSVAVYSDGEVRTYNDVTFWFDSLPALEAWLHANRSERHVLPDWNGPGWYISFGYCVSEYDDSTHYLSACSLADYEAELRDELTENTKQVARIRELLNESLPRDVTTSMIASDSTVELPEFVRKEFLPGQFVYFVKREDGFRLMTQDAMDVYLAQEKAKVEGE